ncbi:MAG: N-formylglutamate amidohydrolase [Gammaproteobacteria bacterium]|nr:N-formylglutamate amidohydrolase [Gammaproteobacteria bacterium]
MKPTVLVISCEHAVNKVPAKYADLFAHKKLLLKTPRAYDIGATQIATYLQKHLDCEYVKTKITRLLIDCDHSLQHKHCFSKYSKKLSTDQKDHLIETYYNPFYQELQDIIEAHIAAGRQVLHVSIYTFMPIFKGMFLNTGIGILYDSYRHGEKEVARIIHGLLMQETPAYKIRLNYPFSGKNDHILQSFRKSFAEKDYLGIKLGVNQALLSPPKEGRAIREAVTNSLSELLMLL